jgi:uncharacterized protein YbjT (DUF2867 family)
MNDFLQALKQPEYVHVLLNPLPVYATAMGVLALIVGLILRSRAAQGVALFIVIVGSLSVWPVVEFGDRAKDRVESMSNATGVKWLHEHEERADDAAWIFYVTAALAAAGIIAQWKFPKAVTWLTLAALAGALACLGAGGWISQAGGKIRHSEFRTSLPSSTVHDVAR